MLVRKMLSLLLALLVGAFAQECKFYQHISPRDGSFELRYTVPPNSGQPSTCYWYYFTDENYRLTVDCYSVMLGSPSDKLMVVGSEDHDGQDFWAPFNVETTSRKVMLILNTAAKSKGGSFACNIRAINQEFCDCGWSPKTRIVGGTKAGINEFPSMVSILDIRKKAHACGGAIISENFVITAAHCLDVLEVRLTGLLVGEHDMRTGNETDVTRLYRAVEFITHSAYDRKLTWNDIGLIRSMTPIKFNKKVGPICLPFNRPFMPVVDEFVTAIGWGTTSFGGPISEVLMKAKIKVIPEAKCREVFNIVSPSGRQVCTFGNGKDTCQMDSGGPIISSDYRTARFFLSAIVSFGPPDCGGDKPAVNTKITSHLDWIQQRTGENFCIK